MVKWAEFNVIENLSQQIKWVEWVAVEGLDWQVKWIVLMKGCGMCASEGQGDVAVAPGCVEAWP